MGSAASPRRRPPYPPRRRKAQVRRAKALPETARGWHSGAMGWVDFGILALVVGGGFLGFRNGVISWALTLVGLAVGVFLASRLYTTLDALVPGVESEGLRQLIAFAGVLVAALVASWLLARVVKTTMSMLMLGWADRAAGTAVGLLVGALAASSFVAAAGIMPSESLKDAVRESRLAEQLLDATGFLRALMPSDFRSVGSLFG